MLFIVGSLVVIGCVVGGYMAQGGHLEVLFQPFELVIIVGAAFGAFIIANPMPVLKRVAGALGNCSRARATTRQLSRTPLPALHALQARQVQGHAGARSACREPDESTLLQHFPGFAGDHHAVEFLCDYLRMVTWARTICTRWKR